MIKIEHLTKCYGSFTAVSDLSFEIDDGHVYGFLGPNGAGKSTTMNIITGCLSPTDGSVSIDGHDIIDEPEAAKRLIGYLPEIPPLYVNETPDEYLRFVGEAKGLHGAELKARIDKVAEETGITAMRGRLISSLSKGYRQRVGIAQALLGDPKLIILDEPTVGLDPLQIIEIRELIRRLGETHTVIFSSHILSEVQAICDRVLIIAHGKLVAYDTPDNLEQLLTGSGEILVKTRASAEAASAVLNKNSHIGEFTTEPSPDGDGILIHASADKTDLNDVCCELAASFAEHKLPIYELSSHKADLEEIFLELTSDEHAAASGSSAYTAFDSAGNTCSESNADNTAASPADAGTDHAVSSAAETDVKDHESEA